MKIEELITDNIDVWTTAIKKRSATGRGSNKKIELTGIKKLRELILELAVRGKLVPQDPNDEPASVLLDKIAVEKAQLIKDKKIKKTKALPEIGEDEKPFELPNGWEWVRFGECVSLKSGSSFAKERELDSGEVPYCKVGDMNMLSNIYALTTSSRFINPTKNDLNKLIPEGSIAFPKRGGAIATNKKRYIHKAVFVDLNIMTATPFKPLSLSYVMKWLDGIDLALLNTGTSVPQINNKDIEPLVFPCPPMKEQVRIVAKVDELMLLCDQLEQQTEDSITAHQTLVETLLATLSNSENPAVFNQNWTRIAEHFDTLFTTEHSIDQLKQTILQLAVMGKLVPQNPNDEPASVLLEKIAAEKEQLIKDKKIKKQKPLPAITEDEKPFELPNGWEWSTLSHLGVFSGGKTPSKSKSEYWDGSIPWVTPKDMKIEEIYDSEDHVTQLAIVDGLAEINKESLLFVARSGILRRKFPVAITKSICTVNQDLKVLSLFDTSISYYLLIMMKGFEVYILKNLTKMGTTVESLRFEDFSKHYFIFPPSSEQHRIVKKIDELITLCDQLKAQINNAQTTQLHLADTIVEQAVN